MGDRSVVVSVVAPGGPRNAEELAVWDRCAERTLQTLVSRTNPDRELTMELAASIAANTADFLLAERRKRAEAFGGPVCMPADHRQILDDVFKRNQLLRPGELIQCPKCREVIP